ncbi:MAG: hypothetical protein AAB584_01900 [Patescibacteria group bacterium]
MEGPKFEKPEEAKPETEKSASSFDELVSGIKEKLKDTEIKKIEQASQERMTQEQREAEAREQIAPLQAEYEGMKRQEDFFEGGRFYYALKGKKDGYTKWLQEDRENMIAEEEVYSQMANKYKEISGANFGGHVSQTREEMMVGWSKYPVELMMEYDEANLMKRGPVTGKIRKGVRSPEQLIDEMKAYRDYMASKEYRGREAEDYENKVTDDVYGFHRVAEGTGLAALEAGDVRMAAKALSFAQSVEEMPQEVLTRIKQELSNLDEGKRKEFVIAFESLREKPKETH